jgi:hypothetical protein
MSDNCNAEYISHAVFRRHSFSDLDRWKDVPCLTTDQMKTDVHFIAALREIERRGRRLKLATEALQVGSHYRVQAQH